MSDNDTILGESLSATTTTPVVQTEEQFITENVGEGKKYKTEAEALRALAKKAIHADSFIEQLKEEKRQLESTYGDTVTKLTEVTAKERKVEEILAAIKNQTVVTATVPAMTTQTVTPEELNRQLEVLLEQRQSAAVKKANSDKAWALLDVQYGTREAAKEAIKQFIGTDAALRTTVGILGESNPEKLVEFVASSKRKVETFTDPNESTHNTGAVYTASGMTWAKAKEVKKADPKKFWSPQFQSMLHEAAAKNPDFKK